MAKLVFSGPTREADAESARAAAVLAGDAAHVHVIPFDEAVIVLTGDDAPQDTSPRIITVEEFRDLLGVQEGAYERFGALNKHVIKLAVMEINALAPFMPDLRPPLHLAW